MPLFDIQCRVCASVQEVIMIHKESVSHFCKECNFETVHDTLAPLCAMQPDTMWSGVTNQHGHFTSKSYYNRFLKQRNLERIDKSSNGRSIFEEVSKKQKHRKDPKRLEKQASENVRKFLEKEIIPGI